MLLSNLFLCRYELLSEKDYFTCDSTSGVITLKKSFVKSQSKPKYILKVKASDNGKNILSSEAMIEIPVINKDQPMFTKNYNVIVSEDAPVGQNLIQIKAHGCENRQVYYEISNGDEFERFDVGFTSGMCTLFGFLCTYIDLYL